MYKNVKLYTIHPIAVWETLEREGVLRGVSSQADTDFTIAYQWMMLQMKKRTRGYCGGHLLWAWRDKPSFEEYSTYVPAGHQGVCIEFVAPRERILLSDYMLWHSVLNGSYIGLTEAEEDRCGRSHSQKSARHAMRQSWEKIFDFDLIRKHRDWLGTPDYVQATFEYLRLAEVINVEHFFGGCR